MTGETNGCCECGQAGFTVKGKPLVRIFCHCTICQSFNNAAYGDVSLFHADDVMIHDKSQIDFKKYMKNTVVERGKCKACNTATIETANPPLIPELVIIPTANIKAADFIVEPLAHIYYHSCQQAIEDKVPKYSGALKSQLFLARKLIKGLLQR